MKRIIVLFLLSLTVAQAQEVDENYLTLARVRKQVFKPVKSGMALIGEETTQLPKKPEFGTKPIAGSGGSPYDILDTFTKIWTIIEKNQPVVTIESTSYATALPAASKNDWEMLSDWKPESNYTIVIDYDNNYGINVIHLVYQVKVVYGGNLDGVGKYIAAARIIPTEVDVMWGFKLNVTVSSPVVFNVGKRHDPIAAIQLNIMYNISTILKNTTVIDTFQVQGDGKIIDTKRNENLVLSKM